MGLLKPIVIIPELPNAITSTNSGSFYFSYVSCKILTSKLLFKVLYSEFYIGMFKT